MSVRRARPGDEQDILRLIHALAAYEHAPEAVRATPEGLAAFGQAGFDMLLQSVSSMLATNGAEQSRVLHALDQARTRGGNLEAAGSRVSDVDVAREVTRLGRASIRMEASRAVMTQANVLGELAVRLLQG